MLCGVNMDIRLSCGSEVMLGLRKIKTCASTETAYILTRGVCQASCSFCSQSKNKESNKLSRVTWNIWKFDDILPLLNNQKRVCIQCLNYPEVFDDLIEMVRKIKCPVSVSAQPFSIEEMRQLSEHVDRISISLDCFTPELFSKYKPFYNWDLHWARMKKAVDMFGKGKVISHLIVGLGETEQEAVRTMEELVHNGVIPSLFAFTPIKGTDLEENPPPMVGSYRRLQIARHLLVHRLAKEKDMIFSDGTIISFGVPISKLISSEVFITQGCPNCNRPFFNEIPGKTIYNFPYPPSEDEYKSMIKQSGVKQ